MTTPEPLETPQILPHGLDGLVVRFAARMSEPANRAAIAFRAALEADPLPGVSETASALASVYLRFDPSATRPEALAEALRARLAGQDWTQQDQAGPTRHWHVPTAYSETHAPQLREAAALAGVTPEDAVRDLSTTPVRVLAIGFAPGQPYLGELPAHWNIARQTGLTPQVPEGALVVAVRQFVLFANPSPTGWRHVGQTAFRCFRPEAGEPMPLRPGDLVTFHAVSDQDFADIRASDPSGGGARLEVGG